MTTRLSGAELRIVLAIVRMTAGYQRESTPLSRSLFSRMTGLRERTITRALRTLRQKAIIERTNSSERVAVWRIREVDSWTNPSGTKVAKMDDSTPDKSGQRRETKLSTIKERNKDKSRRKKSARTCADDRFQPIVGFFFEHFTRTRGVKLDTDAGDFGALRRLLKRRPEDSVDYLISSARLFLESRNNFHLSQGRPLRYWASNINGFIPKGSFESTEKGTGDGRIASGRYRGHWGLNA